MQFAREEEGKLLRKVTEKEVVNIARYYYHKTVYIGGKEDNIYNNVRKGLDIIRAINYKLENLIIPLKPAGVKIKKGQSSSRKRSSSYTNAPLPPNKRTYLGSPPKGGRDYRKPLYKASSWAVMLTTLEGGIKGYKSLYTRAGPLEARGKTSIRVFMAIRIYIHYNGPNKKGNVINKFNKWNSVDTEELAKIKKEEVDNKGDFLKSTDDNFLPYY
ncbi:hypothetical protein V2W45_1465811 [Cenococcum geophilum]